ncbi:hypothetical protein [Haloferax sp. ATB1]|uniref:hypothetical protein n=1 Tax=Haloferax sp. ATB1 TaxID=1508454 RepID=UPI001F51F65F|nr:hypothetical protein [Haloferax sp. ATB1]
MIALLTALWMVSMRRLLRSSRRRCHTGGHRRRRGVGSRRQVVGVRPRMCWKVRTNRRSRDGSSRLVGIAVQRRLLPRTEVVHVQLRLRTASSAWSVYRTW